MGRRKKSRGIFDIMFVREDWFNDKLRNYHQRRPEDPPHYRSKNIIVWKINYERDENGEAIIKDGYAKVYIYGAFINGNCGQGYSNGDRNRPFMNVMLNLVNDVNDRYGKLLGKLPMDPDIFRFYPLNIDERRGFEKRGFMHMVIERELW